MRISIFQPDIPQNLGALLRISACLDVPVDIIEPCGFPFSEKKLNELISWAYKNDIILINDNPYSYILNKKPRSILSLKNSKGVTIELNSLSKSFNMAGWRVGMMVGESKFIDAVLKVKSNFDSGMFYCVQYGAIRALATSYKLSLIHI